MIDLYEGCFNTYSPSVHTAPLLPKGLFSFLGNNKLLQLNNNCGKNRGTHTFDLFWGLAGTKFFHVPGIALKPRIHHVYSFTLQYTLCCSLVVTVVPPSTPSTFVTQLFVSMWLKGTSCSPQGGGLHVHTPSGPADPTCIGGLYH